MNHIVQNFETNSVNNILNSWTNAKNNHTYLENIYNSEIKIDNNININDIYYSFNNIIDNNKRTLYINNCKNINIRIFNKFNHIIVINCENILIDINNGLVSGMDIIHTKKATIRSRYHNINHIEISYSSDCSLIFDKISGNNLIINTNYCNFITFYLSDINLYKCLLTNKSIFSYMNYYVFNNHDIKSYDINGIEFYEN
jgi:hypothetical protein